MTGFAPGHLVLCSVLILACCGFAAWRHSGTDGEALRGNLVWALAGASILNLSLAALWYFTETLGGPAIFVLAVGLPYLAGMMLTRSKPKGRAQDDP